MTIEIWQGIPGFPGYKASDQGKIGSCLIWGGGKAERWAVSDEITRILRPKQNKGYAVVTLHRDDGRYSVRIATLVMLAFHGPPPEGMEVCHGDNDSGNDWLYNLRYDTHLANMRESALVGKSLRKFTPEQAETARIEYAEGDISQRALARKRGISPSAMWDLLHGFTYTDVGGPIL